MSPISPAGAIFLRRVFYIRLDPVPHLTHFVSLTHISDVCTKYQEAAKIVNLALTGLVSQCLPGATILQLCEFGHTVIQAGVSKLYTKKVNGIAMDRGVAFPVCISVNDIVCNHSPLLEEERVRAVAYLSWNSHRGPSTDPARVTPSAPRWYAAVFLERSRGGTLRPLGPTLTGARTPFVKSRKSEHRTASNTRQLYYFQYNRKTLCFHGRMTATGRLCFVSNIFSRLVSFFGFLRIR